MSAVSTQPRRASSTTATVSAATPPLWPAVLRITFGVILGIDAVLKWLPGYRSTFVSQLKDTAQGQPGFLHGWFHFWISISQSVPNLFVTLTGIGETGLAIVLLFGVARRAGYIAGALYMLFVWAVGEGFGGPYSSGATDIGGAVIYVVVFLTLLAFAPEARSDRWALDGALVARISWWRHVAEPHARDRAR